MANLRLREDLDDWSQLPVQYDKSTIETMQLGEIKELLKEFPPEFIGPSWQRDENGLWLAPEHTIGWQQAYWAAKHLRGPLGGPWVFTPEQLRFLLHWQAVDDTGDWMYQTGILQRNKGWGKDPFGMTLGVVKWIGPSQFHAWDPQTGNPIAASNPSAWVQIAAVSLTQTRNASSLLPTLIPRRTREKFDLKVQQEVSRQRSTGAQLQMAASNPEALQGGRTTFAIADETQHWYDNNQGKKMWETMQQNTAKVGGQILCITNAFLPGEDSVAETQRREYDDYIAGKGSGYQKMLYDSVEAHPETPATQEALRSVFPIIRGDSTWLKVETIIPSFMSLSISLSKSRRMWLNQVVASDDALLPPDVIESVMDSDLRLMAGDQIVLGFDGGRADDATALVAVRTSDYSAFLLGLWEKPSDRARKDWVVPEGEVDAFVRDVYRRYDVVGHYSDRAMWESWIHAWERDFADRLVVKATAENPIGWDMRGRKKSSTLAHELLLSAIERKHISISPHPQMRAHMANAVREENTYGVSFRKASPDSPRKVDAYAALMLAYLAATDYRRREEATVESVLYIQR